VTTPLTHNMLHPLSPKLKQLRLAGMLDTLEVRAAEAVQERLSPVEFLALLIDDELERRDQSRLRRHLQEAGCTEGKTLVRELATCAFVGRHENVLICGPTGVGKSHLSAAVSFEAVKRGYRVVMQPVHHLLQDLHAARADGSYGRKMRAVSTVDLLVLDDFGLRPLAAQAVDDLYEIISARYECRSIVLTSNRALEEWPEVFGDGLLASAALDRLTHHAQTLVIRGQSYRQRERRKEREESAQAPPAAELDGPPPPPLTGAART
jgi:IstB-like ATP binding protein